jgi:hypothetical protein
MLTSIVQLSNQEPKTSNTPKRWFFKQASTLPVSILEKPCKMHYLNILRRHEISLYATKKMMMLIMLMTILILGLSHS